MYSCWGIIGAYGNIANAGFDKKKSRRIYISGKYVLSSPGVVKHRRIWLPLHIGMQWFTTEMGKALVFIIHLSVAKNMFFYE